MLMNAQSWDGGAQRDMARPESMLLLYFPERFDFANGVCIAACTIPDRKGAGISTLDGVRVALFETRDLVFD